MVEAWNARDARRPALGFCHPEIEYTPLFIGVDGATYHGHEGIREYFRDIEATISDSHIELESAEELGDAVIADGHARATGSSSGVPLDWRFAQAVVFRDGLIVWAISAGTREEAVDAARSRTA